MAAPAIVPSGRLTADVRTRLCVVGAGMTGLSTAYIAARAGEDVVVVDSGPIADGDSAPTTAHLTCILDRRFFELVDLHGAESARLAAGSHLAAIDRIESIVHDERIDCGFERVDAFLFTPPARDRDDLEREYEAMRELDLGVAWAGGAPLGRYRTGRCLRVSGQAQIDPREFMRGLAGGITRHGGRVFAHAQASEIVSGRPGRVTIADGPTIEADDIVVATHVPVCSKLAMHAKQTPCRTYAIAIPVPRGAVPHALVYDTLTPYHYVRVQAGVGSDLLIVGGEDHPTGRENEGFECWESLERWTRERYPGLPQAGWRWSGEVFDSHDGLAFIGRDHGAAHLSLATGFSGSGMTYGMIAGLLLHDMLAGKPNPWAKLYDPGRRITKRAQAGGDSAGGPPGEEYPEDKESRSLDSIRPGDGAIVRKAGHPYAVYRDVDGSLTRCSARCTHMGCEVRWNAAEKTWDCTCHGSRFNRHGEVIGGPAMEDLKPVGTRQEQEA